MSCLVIEDDVALAGLVCRALGQAGHSVSAVQTIAEARTALQNRRFSTLICDYALPDGTAIDLLDLAGCASPAPRIFVMTGSHAFPSGAAAACAMGLDTVLRKPFAMEALVAAVGAPGAAA